MSKIVEYIAFLLFLIAASSETGFKFVQILVQIQQWIEKALAWIVVNKYYSFWTAVFLITSILLCGIWYELHKTRKNREKQPMMYPDDDLYDKAVK
jgi:hypothetical protein